MENYQLKALIEENIRKENKNLDYKVGIGKKWNQYPKDIQNNLIKDIISMSNTSGGGKIIIGLSEDFTNDGLDDSEFNSFDQTEVNKLLEKYASPFYPCQVTGYKMESGKKVVIISVNEFEREPVICKMTVQSSENNNKIILQGSGFYIRSDKATSALISNESEMRGLVGRSIEKNKEELLNQIQRLLEGKKTVNKEEPDIEKKMEKFITDADLFNKTYVDEKFKGLGYWSFCAYPTCVVGNIDIKEVKRTIAESEVSLRGWNFPHTDQKNASYFNNGYQSFTVSDFVIESYRAYSNGLFLSRRSLWEDLDNGMLSRYNQSVISFVSEIWSVTEFLIFISKYYSKMGIQSDIKIIIELNGVLNRKLISTDSMASLLENYICRIPSIKVFETVSIDKLIYSYKEIAAGLIKQIFTLFNFDDATVEMIESWQDKLIKNKI